MLVTRETPVHATLRLLKPMPSGITLLGRNGSGKSTLLNIMGLLDDPTGGEIEIERF